MSNGQENVHWLQVGVAFETDKGIDVKLWVTPPPDNEGNLRVFLREPTEEDLQREAEGRARAEQRRQQQRGGGYQQRGQGSYGQQQRGPKVEYRQPPRPPPQDEPEPPPQDDEEPPF